MKNNQRSTLLHIYKIIRNGEIYQEKEDCLFEGKVNPGGRLVVYGNVYMLGTCLGTIELVGKGVTCSSSKMQQASIIINGVVLDDITIDGMATFYEEDGEIKMKQEEIIYG